MFVLDWRLPADWSPEEVELIVSDYFDMLAAELRGLRYSKAQHRRQLRPLLSGRSEGAIERKHGNISAALIEHGFPYVSGYRPYSNYQRLLFEVVERRLAASQELVGIVAAEVEAPAMVPAADDLLAAMVAQPPRAPRSSVRDSVAHWCDDPPGRRVVDYLKRESENAALGRAGEEFIVAYERARLTRSGCGHLAARVDHVAQSRGDGAGFDILSYEESGRERLIEVKTTRYGALVPFYVSRNEVKRSEVDADLFHLYRVHEFRKGPRIFSSPGAISANFELAPDQFVARIAAG